MSSNTNGINPDNAQAYVVTILFQLTGKAKTWLNDLATSRAQLISQQLKNDYESASNKVSAGMMQALGTGMTALGTAGMAYGSANEMKETGSLQKEFDGKIGTINKKLSDLDNRNKAESGVQFNNGSAAKQKPLSEKEYKRQKTELTRTKEKHNRDLESRRSDIRSSQLVRQNVALAVQNASQTLPQMQQQVEQAEDTRHQAVSKLAQSADQTANRLYDSTNQLVKYSLAASNVYDVSVAMAG